MQCSSHHAPHLTAPGMLLHAACCWLLAAGWMAAADCWLSCVELVSSTNCYRALHQLQHTSCWGLWGPIYRLLRLPTSRQVCLRCMDGGCRTGPVRAQWGKCLRTKQCMRYAPLMMPNDACASSIIVGQTTAHTCMHVCVRAVCGMCMCGVGAWVGPRVGGWMSGCGRPGVGVSVGVSGCTHVPQRRGGASHTTPSPWRGRAN